jgi:aerobic carbon-monoxide dehydrogenase medium subunit
MRDFDYLQPQTIAQACGLLAEYGDGARLIGGGTALMLALRQRMLAPAQLVSLAAIRALRGIAYNEATGLRIGAMTLHAEVARHPLVRKHYPMLADMAAHLANPQVRNQGTIGGNLCYGDPSTDPPSCLIALDASLALVSPRGERVVSVSDFLVDYFTTALAADEILHEIRLPPPDFDLGAHARFCKTAADHRPLINIALTIKRCDNLIGQMRLVVGASTATPTRARAAEAFLTGKEITASLAREAADIVADGIEPISDLRGSAEYRRDMVRVFARRTIERLCGLSSEQGGVA